MTAHTTFTPNVRHCYICKTLNHTYHNTQNVIKDLNFISLKG